MKGPAVKQRRGALARPRERRRTYEGLSADQLRRLYRTMLLSRRLDDREIQMKNQSLIFFQISGAGHEAILAAAGMVLKPGYDWFYPYYRDRALCLALGVTPLEMLLAAVGAKDDPSSGGRQMPSHWGHRARHIVSQSSPTGTQCLQAVGCAEAGMIFARARPGSATARRRGSRRTRSSTCRSATARRARASSGSRSTPPASSSLPVVFLVEDNGYAISVPVDGADARRQRRRRSCSGFPGLHVVDGGRHRRREELRRDARGGRLRPRPQGPGARAREGRPALLALAVRRRAALQDRRPSAAEEATPRPDPH